MLHVYTMTQCYSNVLQELCGTRINKNDDESSFLLIKFDIFFSRDDKVFEFWFCNCIWNKLFFKALFILMETVFNCSDVTSHLLYCENIIMNA